ncbi:hypothetical protein WICPIJ_009506 [Wickerhamomyces pijperi]|uniref:Uncharacterized protein n=1 Tax=Wickerhamomyces pijperi TaxID=599730 RepID=A0A9P8TCT2_WICPI|nr:hypothetical protein WICPIJ_009506 [Wickerhamomyces pijperi]
MSLNQSSHHSLTKNRLSNIRTETIEIARDQEPAPLLQNHIIKKCNYNETKPTYYQRVKDSIISSFHRTSNPVTPPSLVHDQESLKTCTIWLRCLECISYPTSTNSLTTNSLSSELIHIKPVINKGQVAILFTKAPLVISLNLEIMTRTSDCTSLELTLILSKLMIFIRRILQHFKAMSDIRTDSFKLMYVSSLWALISSGMIDDG